MKVAVGVTVGVAVAGTGVNVAIVGGGSGVGRIGVSVAVGVLGVGGMAVVGIGVSTGVGGTGVSVGGIGVLVAVGGIGVNVNVGVAVRVCVGVGGIGVGVGQNSSKFTTPDKSQPPGIGSAAVANTVCHVFPAIMVNLNLSVCHPFGIRTAAPSVNKLVVFAGTPATPPYLNTSNAVFNGCPAELGLVSSR